MRKKIYILVIFFIVLLFGIYFRNSKDLFVFSSYQGFVVDGDTIVKYYNYGGNVVIPSSIDGVVIKRIGDYAFTNLEIESVILPDSIIEIGDYAFANNSLSYLNLPSSLTRIGEGSFMHNQLENISFNSKVDLGYACFNDNNLDIENSFFYNSSNENELVSYGGKIKGNIVLPEYTQIIGDKAFMDTGIVSISIHDNVSSIKSNAFKGNNLVEVYLSSNIEDISVDAFSDNEYLMEIFIDNYDDSVSNSPWGADYSNVFWIKK